MRPRHEGMTPAKRPGVASVGQASSRTWDRPSAGPANLPWQVSRRVARWHDVRQQSPMCAGQRSRTRWKEWVSLERHHWYDRHQPSSRSVRMTSIPRKLLANPEDPREPSLVRRGAHSRKGPERCLVLTAHGHSVSIAQERLPAAGSPHRSLTAALRAAGRYCRRPARSRASRTARARGRTPRRGAP
jgi:hypothetical protein